MFLLINRMRHTSHREHQPPPPPLYLWPGCPLGMAQAYSLPSAAGGGTDSLSAAVGLAPESRFRGRVYGCDCSNY